MPSSILNESTRSPHDPGYYIYHRHSIAGMNTLFAQLWKEYTLSDSRYLTLDVFTVCVETITVVRRHPPSDAALSNTAC